MKAGWKRVVGTILWTAPCIVLLSHCTRTPVSRDAPAATVVGGPRPSEILRHYSLHTPPPLASAGDVPRFLDWAGASHVDEKEDARQAVAAAAGHHDIVQALIDEIERVQFSDHTRALLTLALLGETRSADAQRYFSEFVKRPLPTQGTLIEGEIIEQTRAAQLQAKAVDGLAYANSESSNRVVMEVISGHPSKIVRAEAINAYLWNHGDTDEARKALSRYVRKDDQILLDRVRRSTGESADAFNRKLAQFLRLHPEAIPPPPDKAQQTAGVYVGKGRASDARPPGF